MVSRIAVIDLWTDDNRGDAALQVSLARLLRERFPGARLTGVYRFGFNEFDRVGREVAVSSREFDAVLGGPRLTWIGGKGPQRASSGRQAASQLYSLVRFLWAAAAFRALGACSARLMTQREYAAFAAAREADLIVWKGKNFREYGSLTTAIRSVTLCLGILPAMLFRKRILCVNASFWRIENPIARFVYRQVMSRCEYVTVREADSLRFLRELVPGHRGLRQAPDLSFKVLADIHERHLRHGTALAEREARVALTVTEWGSESQKANYIDALGGVLATLAALGIRQVTIVPQVIRQREDNSGVVRRLLAVSPPSLDVEIIEREMTIEELVDAYGRCRLLIGTRMHSCVFARAAGTPFVAIAYDEGSKWAILGEFWPKRFVHDYSSVSGKTLSEDVAWLLQHGASAIAESEPRLAALGAAVRAHVPDDFAEQ